MKMLNTFTSFSVNSVKSRLPRFPRGFSSGRISYYLPAPKLRQAGKILVAVFALFIFNSSLLITNPASAGWVQVSNGMGNTSVTSFAYSGNYLFAGVSVYGIYKSTDNGTSWTQTSLNNRNVWSLAVNGNYLFAGTDSTGVYLSTNNGTSWIQTSLNNRTVYSLAVSGNNIFAGTGELYGVYLSTNNGTIWTQTSLNNRSVGSLVVSGNYIFAGTEDYGVYLSTNNGTNWTQTSLNFSDVHSLAVNGNYMFAGSGNNGVYLSTNNGTTWTQTSLNNLTVISLAVNGNNVFAGIVTPFSFYASNDNGTSWIQRNEGLNQTTVLALCILNNYIFAGTLQNSVYRRPLSELIGIHPISEQLPSHYALEQNYPNPFNPTTKIRFDLPSSPLNERGAGGFVSLKVYDILGREVATLVNEQLEPGTYEVEWDGGNYPSGVYYYKLTAGNFVETKKMNLLK